VIQNKIYQFKGSDKRLITADLTYKASDDPQPIIIFCHGFKGFKDWGVWHLCAQYFAINNIPFFKFNFSHNGTTPKNLQDFVDLIAFSNNTFSKEMEDLDLVLDFVLNKSENLPFTWNGKFYLIGHSRGGGIALAKAINDKRINKVVVWAGVTDFESHLSQFDIKTWRESGVVTVRNSRTNVDMPISYSLYEDYCNNIHTLNLEKLLPDLNIPVFGIYAENDTSISPSNAKILEDNVEHSIVISIENTNHTFGMKHPSDGVLSNEMREVLEETYEFLV
jgi:pimeloyl-ACP methyl ester carboxylesterase